MNVIFLMKHAWAGTMVTNSLQFRDMTRHGAQQKEGDENNQIF